MSNKHFVAFVGPENIYNAFKNMEDSWDLQIPLPTLDSLQQELSADEGEGGISPDTSVIIFFSRLYKSNPRKFAELVAYTCPYSVVCILIPPQDIHEKITIETEIRSIQAKNAIEDDSYNQNTPFYFVDYNNPQADIFESIYSFVNNPIIDKDISSAVKKMLPNDEIPEIEDLTDYEEIDEVLTIPEKSSDDKSTIISVTSSKGGSGKSTVTLLLANYLAISSKKSAEKGQLPEPLKIVVVDMDTRDGQLGFLNNALQPSIIDIVYAGDPNIENIKKGIFHNHRTGVDYIFAAKRPRSAKEIPNSYYIELINNLRKIYDVIILDTSVNYLDPLLECVCYPMSDHILLVSEFIVSSIYGMNRWIKESVERPEEPDKAIPKEKVKIVLNKSLKDINMEVSKIERSAKGLPIISIFPSVPKLVAYCANTSSMEAMLNNEAMAESTKEIVDEIFPDIPLVQLPFKR